MTLDGLHLFKKLYDCVIYLIALILREIWDLYPSKLSSSRTFFIFIKSLLLRQLNNWKALCCKSCCTHFTIKLVSFVSIYYKFSESV